MKYFAFVFVAVMFAVACQAAPPRASSSGDVQILRSESEVNPDSFKYSYATSDGQAQDAVGTLINAGTEQEAIVVRGSFSFVGDDGQNYLVTYVADENGFQPQGAHLPVAPEA